MEDYIIISEGRARLKVPNPSRYLRPDGVYEPSWAPVFYNPRQTFNRDISVLTLKVLAGSLPSPIRVLDALAGTGVRAIRYALEVPAVESALANDISGDAFKVIKENIALNSVGSKIRATRLDANALMYLFKSTGRTFNFIDVDPFGSPAPYVRAALWCVRRGGALGITATDVAPLFGIKWVAGSRKYDVLLIKTDIPAEVGIRVLLGYIARRAAELDRFIKPLLTFVKQHYVRLFITVRKGATEATRMLDNSVGFLLFCRKCLYRSVTTALSASSLNCPVCGSRLSIIGPMWLGPIGDPNFLNSLLEEVMKPENRYMSTIDEAEKLVRVMLREAMLPNLYSTVSAARYLKINTPPTKYVIMCLESIGFEACRSHLGGHYVRTNASWSEFLKCFKGNLTLSPQ